ncbi:MAG TPA: hypothetical protein DCZ91_07850 [Lachnospiraceae bacterium]|nr:hypothetical protein [Lachnospiraceae bacterium]
MRFSKAVVKYRIPILILAFVLMIPSLLGMAGTRINYDMLDYLPEDMDTVIGQNELMDEFGKGAFSFIIVEDMPDKDVSKLKEQIEQVEHVETVIWYDSLMDLSVPKELLPDKIWKEFNTDHSTMMAVFFDSSTSADITMDAIREIRAVCGKQCYVSGMSALVTDLKDLCEKEEPIYVGIAVALACAAMLVLLDGWLVPFVFLASIGIMILLNLGSNYFMGEISYITKALSAVLQLAVTMDYSIFLWHSYNEQRERLGVDAAADREQQKSGAREAMAAAIQETLASVVGSSITTIAGFIALCFMSFTMGRDLGIVMAKGVLLGVLGCVTVLPALILVLDKPLQATKHRSLIPNMGKFAEGTVKVFAVFLAVFAVLIPPAYYGYSKTNGEVYYDMGECLPEDMEYVIANSKLQEEFNIASTHMLLLDTSVSPKNVRSMIREMEDVDGVKYVLGLESVIGSLVPEEILPESVTSILKSDKWELMLINSEYRVASDEVNDQINELNSILKKYDEGGMLIGEAPCMKDMIETTDHDFKVVNAVSIIAIFVIIALVEKSVTLPFILISVIELAIFINLGLPHYLGQSLPFIAPICISTIQLGATVDYAILMTTRYKEERVHGKDKKQAVTIALSSSIPSIIVSGMGLFAATFGVAVYSNIDIISSMCMLMARGAVVSMLCVVFILPALLRLCDGLICVTTIGMGHSRDKTNNKTNNKTKNRMTEVTVS